MVEVAQSVSISQRVVTQDRDFQPMHVDDDDRTQSMLERVTDSPVLQTARLKPDLEARFIALLRNAMAQHAGAEELAEKHPSREAQLRAATAGRGSAGDDEDDVEELTTRYFELQKTFQQRLQMAEMGNWDGLLQEYFQRNGEDTRQWGRGTCS